VRSRKRTLGVILTVLAAGLFLAAVAWAQSSSQTASAGGVSATFTYSGSGITVTNPRLRIVRAGQTAYEEPVHAALCGSICGPGALGAHAHSVRVIRLEPSGAPDVILELFSGGANCCFIDQVFTYSPFTHGYLKTERNFGSFGVTVKRIGKAKHWRFVSADENFKYEFTDGAASGEPIQIWSFSGRRFHDVTRHYPNLIATDAKRWLHFFKQNLSNGVGLIAAWAADEELLGQDKLVQSTLATEARQGDLRDGNGGGATGQRFITKLNRFLHQLGYRH
jgi:hypothetical protein